LHLHLGHHFYGAGNLGDDFMLAGFLAALGQASVRPRLTSSVPFPLEPLRDRFPTVEWLPYDAVARATAIAQCDAWLGLGGSPFQNAQSRWFIDHLIDDARTSARHAKPMFFLGVGVQTTSELAAPDTVQVCRQAAGIWTRDAASAERLRGVLPARRIHGAADLAHLLFAAQPPPPAQRGRCTLVCNFDFNAWPGQQACLAAVARLQARDHFWLAQESRELPGAELALHRALPAAERAKWQLVSPEQPGAPLDAVLARWPSGEWLVTSRFHAAIAGAWAGSKIVVIGTNEKLRGIAALLGAPCIEPDADQRTCEAALAQAQPTPRHRLDAAAQAAGGAVNAVLDHVRSIMPPAK
jgi:polysaccharide pyruvyl transferase WcaK-like protein